MGTTSTEHQTETLQAQFEDFQQELIAFVEACSNEDWGKVTAVEQWPVGVVARHIGVAHYPIINLAELMITGQPLPDLTWEIVNQRNAQHAIEHAHCTRVEVLRLLRKEGANVSTYLAGLTDEESNRRAYFDLFGAEVRAYDLIEQIALVNARGHLESVRQAIRA